MRKETLTFGDIEIEKSKFYHCRNSVFLEFIDIQNVLVSGTTSADEERYKYFFNYLYDNNKIKPMHIMLPKTSTHVENCDGQTKWIYFLLKDNELFEKYNTIWDKVRAVMKKQFNSEPVYAKSNLKTKLKSSSDKAADFHNKEIPKVDSNYTYWAIISLDFALNKDGNYYPQVFLKVCKYFKKEKKLLGILLITWKVLMTILIILMKNRLKLKMSFYEKQIFNFFFFFFDQANFMMYF